MGARIDFRTTVEGRPRLPRFNPAGTPAVRALDAWQRVVLCGRTGLYAVETLMKVHAVAVLAGRETLADRLRGVIWLAAEKFVEKRVRVFKIAFNDPLVIQDRAFEYFRSAFERRLEEDGTPNKDYRHLRKRFFWLLTRRTIDAWRVELRLHKKLVAYRPSAPPPAPMKEITRRELSSLKQVDLASLLARETPKTRHVVERMLEGDRSWARIGAGVELRDDAARKRFERFFARMVGGRYDVA